MRVVYQYIAAIHARDPEKLASHFVDRGNEFFKDVDFEVWTSSRPTEPELLEAYGNESRAAVKIGGGYLTWEYRLEKTKGAWKINKERVVE